MENVDLLSSRTLENVDKFSRRKDVDKIHEILTKFIARIFSEFENSIKIAQITSNFCMQKVVGVDIVNL